MGLLTEAMPRDVEVCGEPVPVAWGFRAGLAAEQVDATDARGRLRLLTLAFGEVEDMPPAVLAHPAEAFAAWQEWHSRGWQAMAYGRGGKRARAGTRSRRALDWDADAGIVAADFARLYGIDLTDPALELHWWRFCALALGALRTEGALMRRAAQHRGPAPAGLKGKARESWDAEARSWALPMTVEEARARAMAEFGRR